jgi:hypothetical protein
VDEELKAFFGDLFQETEDERLTRCAGVDDPFSIPDASGYSGNVEQEIQLAETLQSILGIHSEDATGIASTIVATRKVAMTRLSKRQLDLSRIVNQTRNLPQFRHIVHSDGWDRLVNAASDYVEQSVAEAADERCTASLRPAWTRPA